MTRANKKKSREDLAFPIALIPSLTQPAKSVENPTVIKKIIQATVKGAYALKSPSEPVHYSPDYGKKQQPLVSDEQIQLVTHLIESLQPSDAIEAALASQFVISYIRGLKKAQGDHPNELNLTLKLFEFGHQVLETLTKYRVKGAQLISVNYNHNQGQINNIRLNKNDIKSENIEVI
jgi:hypothetical protein